MRRLAPLLLLPLALGACAKGHVSYSPNAGVAIGGTLSVGDGAGATLPDGRDGRRKTGRPYRVAGRTYRPLASADGYVREGIASWYGRKFHGRQTANGERYDMYALSAAHKTLPLPTLVRVTNLENGRQVVVRVNDRGPFVKNRLIDLSYAAARKLGFAGRGTARVRVEALGESGGTAVARSRAPRASTPTRPSGPSTLAARGELYVQLGAFAERGNADRLHASLARKYPDIRIEPHRSDVAGQVYRVRIGPFEDMSRIDETILSLRRDGVPDAIVVVE